VSTALLYVLRKLDIIKFTDDGPDKAAFKRFVPLRILREASPLSIAYLFYMVFVLFQLFVFRWCLVRFHCIFFSFMILKKDLVAGRWLEWPQ
jgi:hypothetical protein